jgi:sensor histidine kinase YesM
VQQLVNTRFVTAEVMGISYYSEMMAKIAEYFRVHFSVILRLKDQTVTADSLSPLFTLLKKKKGREME